MAYAFSVDYTVDIEIQKQSLTVMVTTIYIVMGSIPIHYGFTTLSDTMTSIC